MAKSRRISNNEFTQSNELFKKCCELSDIKPTSRQASKFRRGFGLAVTMKNHEANKLINE